ncbi:MAG: hypothetical protein GAK28_00145 [Luteibacter sp.]|uniref:hypothetical protein n=1 Tax=Luteibacter sp. TaxID=1886636 RepID=UPI0013839E62|nr:hypothetical protein [Luteibacter sp.]KAF1009507.1 MAG: hypothetical protein GAK28_00145 [Luteibacter sp.]
MTKAETIRTVLREAPSTSAEITALTGITGHLVRAHLTVMRQRGHVVKAPYHHAQALWSMREAPRA